MIHDLVQSLVPEVNVVGAKGNLAVATGNVQDIGGQTESGDMASESLHQLQTFFNWNPKVVRARSTVELVKIVRFDPRFDQTSEQIGQRRHAIVDATKQDCLGQDRNPAIDDLAHVADELGADLPWVVDVDDEVDRSVTPRQLAECRRKTAGEDRWRSRVNPQDPNVRYRAETREHRAQIRIGEDQRIAPAENDLPDLRVLGDVAQRRLELVPAQRTGWLADELAAEAKPAVYRARRGEQKQHAIGVAVHKTGHGAVGVVADRIAKVIREADVLVGKREDLTSKRIMGIAPVDQVQIVTWNPQPQDGWLGERGDARSPGIYSTLPQIGVQLRDRGDTRPERLGE